MIILQRAGFVPESAGKNQVVQAPPRRQRAGAASPRNSPRFQATVRGARSPSASAQRQPGRHIAAPSTDRPAAIDDGAHLHPRLHGLAPVLEPAPPRRRRHDEHARAARHLAHVGPRHTSSVQGVRAVLRRAVPGVGGVAAALQKALGRRECRRRRRVRADGAGRPSTAAAEPARARAGARACR